MYLEPLNRLDNEANTVKVVEEYTAYKYTIDTLSIVISLIVNFL